MQIFSLLWQTFAFVVVTNVANHVMSTLEDNEVYGNIAKFLSFCVGSFYFWQALAIIGLFHFLRRLADKFPSPPIDAVDCTFHVGPSMEELLGEKETALQDAASKTHSLEREIVGLRVKEFFLEEKVDFISKERYALIYEKWILKNRLADFNSWRESRIEYDKLATEFTVMKRQRAREQILQEQTLQIAKEAKIQLAAAKQAEAKRKIAQSHELEQARRKRDESKEQYQTLLAAITAAAITAAATATAVAKGNSPEADSGHEQERAERDGYDFRRV